MSKFFIDRPIFAWVIALVIMLAGGLSILSLPVNQYPAIAPPAIAVQVSYPGASAETVQDTVVQVIEQQMNGIDNLRYISSESNSDGSMTKEDLSNYIVSNIQDPLSRTKGVGDFQVFGSQYSMRIWLDPAKLNSYQLTPAT